VNFNPLSSNFISLSLNLVLDMLMTVGAITVGLGTKFEEWARPLDLKNAPYYTYNCFSTAYDSLVVAVVGASA